MQIFQKDAVSFPGVEDLFHPDEFN